MANGDTSGPRKITLDGIQKVLESVPGDAWEKGGVLHELEREASVQYAMIKAVNAVNNTIIKEEKKVQRFVASRIRHQQGFGFGMSVPRSTKQ